MTTLHMETDAVCAIALQLKQTAENLRGQTQALNGTSQSTDWLGPSRDEFLIEAEGIIRQLEVHVEAGVILAGRVQNEVAEWEKIASSFGMDSANILGNLKYFGQTLLAPLLAFTQFFTSHSPYITRTPSDSAPENMQQLAKAVTDLYSTGTPVRVIKTGENEYLVLVTGTEGGQQGNNWNSAISSGLGIESDYQNQLKSILMALPAGAIVNLAGHSQGGIVSENVVTDIDVKKHLEIKSVTTFGSPVSAEPQEGIEYRRYAALGDPVPLLNANEAIDVLDAINNPLKWTTVVKDARDMGETLIPGKLQPHLSLDLGQMTYASLYDLHVRSYSDPDSALTHIKDLPFKINQWGDSDYYYSQRASGSIPLLDKKLF